MKANTQKLQILYTIKYIEQIHHIDLYNIRKLYLGKKTCYNQKMLRFLYKATTDIQENYLNFKFKFRYQY